MFGAPQEIAMDAFADIPAMTSALNSFTLLYGQHLPTETANPALQGNLQDIYSSAINRPSKVTQCEDIAEAFYAFHDDITDADAKKAAMTLCAQLAVFPAMEGWGGALTENTRGAQISWAMRRDLGEAADPDRPWPDPSDDPAVLQAYKKPASPTPSA